MANPARPLPFVLAATDHGSLIVNRLDYRCNDAGAGIGVGWELLGRGAFQPQEIDLVLTLLGWCRELRGDGVVAVDCGANIGVHTIEWARRMTGWGGVLALEAQERIFYALAGNICLNNCFNARALHVAVGDRDGTMAVPQPDYARPGSFGSLELQAGAHTEDIGQPIDYRPEALRSIPAVRLDSLTLPRLDLLKVDVEGMEAAVLAGSAETLARCRPYVLVEHIKAGADALTARLAAHGYRWWPAGMTLLAMPEGDPAIERVRNS
jgi:FkbM family methyltransferase